ncbi:PglZ domain-containing protein [Bacteroidota bacterium]
MQQIKILWVDDEIDLLRPHVIFLEKKGYLVDTTTNGTDALEKVANENFDIILLDENMPGLSGLETLTRIKTTKSEIPVIMITKSEEEFIMDEAIGSKISDYLIKPVNPNQILLSIKKNIDQKKLITQHTTSGYQSDFQNIGSLINDSMNYNDWIEVYKKLIYWELELESSSDSGMDEVLKMQKNEANASFAKFVKSNYLTWFDKNNLEKPLISPNIFNNKIFPHLEKNEQVVVLLIDNLRFDQWKSLQPLILEHLNIKEEMLYYSILPTATQYARNSIFAGLMPSEINHLYPNLWKHDEEEGGKNKYEEELLKHQMERYGIKASMYYEKTGRTSSESKTNEIISNILNHQLSVVVYNFVDMLSHSRTEMEMIKELAKDESAYRSLTLSWFQHSALLELIKFLGQKDFTVILTTDHGTIRVNNPLKIIGDKNTSSNLRYKQGKNLNYNAKQVFEITNPEQAYLPRTHVSTSYVFATNENFFAYPNNYNYYVGYYKDTFQHGGISLEELIIPIITLSSKQ